MLPVQIERKRFRWLQSTGRPLSYKRQQIIDNFIVYYSTLKRYVWPPTATQSRSAMRGSWYRDISSLYQEKKDIYHDIISTIEKRNLSGYDIFLQTHFWILYSLVFLKCSHSDFLRNHASDRNSEGTLPSSTFDFVYWGTFLAPNSNVFVQGICFLLLKR